MSEGKQLSLEELALENFMKSEGGRRFMMSRLQSCSVFESIFNDNPVTHAYMSGLRDAGLQLDQQLKEIAPAYYLKMIEESING